MAQVKHNLEDYGVIVRWVDAEAKQTGKPYQCLEIQTPDGYSERIFLDRPVAFMINSYVEKGKNLPKPTDVTDENKNFLDD